MWSRGHLGILPFVVAVQKQAADVEGCVPKRNLNRDGLGLILQSDGCPGSFAGRSITVGEVPGGFDCFEDFCEGYLVAGNCSYKFGRCLVEVERFDLVVADEGSLGASSFDETGLFELAVCARRCSNCHV